LAKAKTTRAATSTATTNVGGRKRRPKSKTPAAPNGAADRAFVSALIHELRTPLTALRGSLGLLAVAVEAAGPEVQSFAGIADRNAEKLTSMLDEAAEYSRLSDPAAVVNRVRTDVVDTVERAIEQVQPLINERGVVLEVRTTPSDATIDGALVRVAVARLLSYAVRVSPKASTLRIGVETGEDAQIVVTVSDCGKAIGADSVTRIFEPFSTVARRSLEPGVQTGLGLVVAQAIARLHGGAIAFAPTGQGGLFTMRLPV